MINYRLDLYNQVTKQQAVWIFSQIIEDVNMYKKILLATEFDEIGKRAALAAKETAKLNNAELHLLHVIAPISPNAYSVFESYVNVEKMMIDQANQELETFLNEVAIPRTNAHVKRGNIKDETLEFLEQEEIDLLIVGSHGKQGLSRMLGSKANALVNIASCSVLVVRG